METVKIVAGTHVLDRQWMETTGPVTSHYYECPKCRYIEILENRNFCPMCGARIEWVTE